MLQFFINENEKSLSQKRYEIEQFQQNFLPTEYTQNFLPKIVFPPFLAAILNFCLKRKTKFFLEMVRQSYFNEIFGPQSIHRIFCQKLFSHHFWRPS